MIRVGITGGIGSGKSVVCEMFRTLEIPIYQADQRAKWLIKNSPFVKSKIVDLLGPHSYENGNYNKQWVAQKVFTDSTLLNKLNAIVHPAVALDWESWLKANKNQTYVLKEAALMDKKSVDKIILVYAPKEIRINRVLNRDPFRSREDVEAILKNQKTDEEFKEIADFIIENDNEKLLISQVLKLNKELLNA